MSLETNKLELADAPGGGPRFAYPGGSRPLDGFTIKRGIGRGGFGEVYYAVSDAGKEVALKLIRRNLDVEVRGVTQCLNLKHPNLLSLFDIKRDAQDDSWVVMEYVSGDSLEDVLERSPKGMSPPEIRHWLRGIFAGVAYLHDHGIVHRDLKPGNIFSDDGIVKIGDYGLSKFISCSRRSGHTESIGTIHYMAPEIANGRYGKEIDIYALGVIVYEMLTGRVPFEGESIGEVLMKHLTAEPDVSRLAEPYRAAVKQALAKDPAKRIASVEEFARQMQIPLNESVSPMQTTPGVYISGSPTPPPVPEVQVAQAMMHANIAANAAAAREEPILRAIKGAGRQLRDAWHNANFGTPIKVILIVALLAFALPTFPVWFTGLLAATVLYGVYRLIRELILLNLRPRTELPPPLPLSAAPPLPAALPIFPTLPGNRPVLPPPAPQAAAPRFWSRSDRWNVSAAASLRAKPVRARLIELTGSMLLAALVAAIGAAATILLRGQQPEPEQFAWLAIMGTVGAWAVMIPAKTWEGCKGETILRRLTMFVMGLGVGAVGFGVYSFFQVSPNSVVLPWDAHMGHMQFAEELERNLFGPNGVPTLTAFMSYFGFLYLVPRWWLLANPLRSSRLSIWAVAVSVFWAFVLSYFWRFPHPWSLFVAGTIALSVQISSVWLSPEARQNANGTV